MCEDLLAGICGWWHILTLTVNVIFGEKWKEEERRENERERANSPSGQLGGEVPGDPRRASFPACPLVQKVFPPQYFSYFSDSNYAVFFRSHSDSQLLVPACDAVKLFGCRALRVHILLAQT